MSRSSFSSVNSHVLRGLRDKAKVLQNEARHGNPNSRNIIDDMHQIHYNELVRER